MDWTYIKQSERPFNISARNQKERKNFWNLGEDGRVIL
jgi:hypothetical protein